MWNLWLQKKEWQQFFFFTPFFHCCFWIRDPRPGIRDPGSGMGKNHDPGSGIDIPDPQHRFPFRLRLWKVLVLVPAPVPDPDYIYHSFLETKIAQNLPSQCQKQLISKEVGLSFLIFFNTLFIIFYFGTGSKFGSRIGTVPVKHFGYCSTNAKNYSSPGSGSGSTTLPARAPFVLCDPGAVCIPHTFYVSLSVHVCLSFIKYLVGISMLSLSYCEGRIHSQKRPLAIKISSWHKCPQQWVMVKITLRQIHFPRRGKLSDWIPALGAVRRLLASYGNIWMQQWVMTYADKK